MAQRQPRASSDLAPFTGFADQAGSFFRRLAKNQDRAWFAAHKAEYEEGWQRPLDALLRDVREAIDGAYPHVDLAEPRVLRIHRDVRFSKDKSPYKTHVAGGVNLAVGDASMTEAPAAVFLQVGATEGFGGAGLYAMDPEKLARFRAAVLDDGRGKELARIVSGLEKKGFTLGAAETLKKVPKGVDPDHPRASLLRHKGLVVMYPGFDRAALTSRAVRDWLVKTSKQAAPLVEWIAFATR